MDPYTLSEPSVSVAIHEGRLWIERGGGERGQYLMFELEFQANTHTLKAHLDIDARRYRITNLQARAESFDTGQSRSQRTPPFKRPRTDDRDIELFCERLHDHVNPYELILFAQRLRSETELVREFVSALWFKDEWNRTYVGWDEFLAPATDLWVPRLCKGDPA